MTAWRDRPTVLTGALFTVDLCDPRFHDPLNEANWQRLAERKLDGPFRGLERRQFGECPAAHDEGERRRNSRACSPSHSICLRDSGPTFIGSSVSALPQEAEPPCTVIFDAASRISRKSVSLRSTERAPMFSSSRSSLRVPGIGTIQFLCEQPGERDLRGRGAFPLGDAFQQFDHRHVCGARVRCKARRDAAEVGAAEGRARIDRAGQKTRTKRTKRDEADSKFLAGGEHAVVLDIARPQ